MSNSDLYYRALKDYRKTTKDDRGLERRRKNVISSNADGDKIEVVRTNCIINDDWITAIEKGLVHVEKAINEERQFIRSNGEVVSIEKVKNVSKESVEHLARHSNLLTRVTEGEDLIPDGLYTVERLSDFAVYENRFLYMLLCYLRDFISFRYEKILELVYTYNGTLEINKTVHSGSGKMVYTLTLNDERRNDPYLKANNPIKDQIDRIDLILKTVIAFLQTPLMEFVSKAPMLKPPITETNVLKMNKNFKGAKELYYYVSSYPGPGFTAEKVTKVISPFPDEVAEDFAESVELTAFLTYEHGLGIEKQLRQTYEEEEARRKAEEKKKHAEQLEVLRRRVKQSGLDTEEYMLRLEQRNRVLEKHSERLKIVTAELEKANAEIARLNGECASLGTQLDEKYKEIEALNAAHAAELEQLTNDYEEQIGVLNEEHAQQVDELNASHEQEIEELTSSHAEEVEHLNAEHSAEVEELNSKHAEEVKNIHTVHTDTLRVLHEQHFNELASVNAKAEETERELNDKISACNANIASLIAQNKTLTDTLARANNNALMLEGRINALKFEQAGGAEQEEFTTEEGFDEIERQYQAFKRFFKTEWKAAKKQIRKEFLSKENILKNSQKNQQDSASDAAMTDADTSDSDIPDSDIPEMPAQNNQDNLDTEN